MPFSKESHTILSFGPFGLYYCLLESCDKFHVRFFLLLGVTKLVDGFLLLVPLKSDDPEV